MTKLKVSRKKKTNPPKRKYLNYTEESLLQALKDVTKGMSIRAASDKYNIPFSTIRCKIRGIYPLGKKSGPPKMLTNHEESMLINWITFMGNKGFRVTKDMILDSAKILVKQLNRENRFKNDRPGRRWFEHFLKRHPEVPNKIHTTAYETEEVTPEKQYEWFENNKNCLRSKNLLDIDPSRIFSCTEIAFFLNPKNSKLIDTITKAMIVLDAIEDIECCTAMFMGNAAGQILEPMTISSHEKMSELITQKTHDECVIGISDNKWVTGEPFYEYITKVFYPWCFKNQIEFPVVVYVNGHSSNVTMALSDFCTEHKIELISLPPFSTNMNPLHIALYQPLEKAWEKFVSQWRYENGNGAIKKSYFIPFIKKTLKTIDISGNLIDSFCQRPFSSFLYHNNQQIQNTHLHPSTVKENKKIDYISILKFIENSIDSKTLLCFLITRSEKVPWFGEEKYRELFSVWLKCHNLLQHESKLTEI